MFEIFKFVYVVVIFLSLYILSRCVNNICEWVKKPRIY
ncbi:Nodule Cysteine-Rich (NCR) secreted peptide [Medicago truncatula]|uniref:Nodule Cysteine-Rich (NCR) secreted peptide n=1 Tax=Medicago truncatula TaxID=3880 RepID=A0A072UQQ6_MEDTR|nr:Nodule Cysteine-Rich (NCR) secreted peptide [Medicago truncatula]